MTGNMKELERANNNDYQDFLDNLLNAIFEVDEIEEYDNYEEYLDSNGSTLFILSSIDEDTYMFRFYDGSYTIKREFLEDLTSAINKVKNKMQVQAV